MGGVTVTPFTKETDEQKKQHLDRVLAHNIRSFYTEERVYIFRLLCFPFQVDPCRGGGGGSVLYSQDVQDGSSPPPPPPPRV